MRICPYIMFLSVACMYSKTTFPYGFVGVCIVVLITILTKLRHVREDSTRAIDIDNFITNFKETERHEL